MLDLFTNDINFDSAVKSELQLWHRGKELPETAKSSLQHADSLVFPNIRKILINILATSCEAERCFELLHC